MFTTGSKFFLGATVLTTVAALLYGMTTGGQAGITGTIGLASAACALALLAGINYHTRDCNVSGVQQGGGAHTAASTVPPSRSFWPVTAALGGALLVIGADSYPVVFKIGIIVLLATGFEWLVQGWSDRASLDPAYNDSLRKRMMNPIEFPVLAAVGLGILVYSFSRIMLKLPKTAGPVLFVATGAAVVVAGFMLAAMPRAKKGVIAGIAAEIGRAHV